MLQYIVVGRFFNTRIMTPKETAVEITNKYLLIEDTQSKMGGNLMFKIEAKKCALIAVDEILKLMVNEFKWDKNHNGNIHYWQEVRDEVEKLPA